MAVNEGLQPVTVTGWRAGLNNLMRKESGDWWRTRRWWQQALIWLLVVDGAMFSVMLTLKPVAESVGANNPAEDPRSAGLIIYAALGGLFVALGGILNMQGEMLDEKKLGTAAWILSKPVARPAFVVAKLAANAAAQGVLLVLLPGVVAYGVFALNGYRLPIGLFAGALGLIDLHLMFYLTLTLMLGTLSEKRGVVIGLPLLILLGYQFLLQVLPGLGLLMPWALVMTVPGVTDMGLVVDVLNNRAVATMPLVMTGVWCVIFVAVAVWRFNREEL